MFYQIENGKITGETKDFPNLTLDEDWDIQMSNLGYERIPNRVDPENPFPMVTCQIFQSKEKPLHWILITRIDDEFIGGYRVENSLDLAFVVGRFLTV